MSDPDNPVLAAVVREIEAHAAESGWDQQARLFALVPTADLVRREPDLAEALGLAEGAEGAEAVEAGEGLTPVEQEVPADRQLEQVLETIMWPDEVSGCAAVVERLVLPPSADDDLPEGREAAEAFAAEHPDRQEVRLVAAATRAGESLCALRLRAHDDAESVVVGPDLVPALLELLHGTLEN